MLQKFRKQQGFTMVELLVVLVIVAILAAVATPIYLANVKRSRMSEAIATMGLIRQAERDYNVNHNVYFDVADDTATPSNTSGNIQKGLPTSVVAATGVPTPNPSGVDVNVGVGQYFSNGAFFVVAPAPANNATRSQLFTNPAPVDFLISVKGSGSFQCAATTDTNCAIHAGDVATYELEMDNSGRVFVCYATCGTAANWSAY